MIKPLTRFFGEVKGELQKATWPWDPKERGVKRYKELIDATIVVLIAMILLGAYVAFFDFILFYFMQFFLKGFQIS